MTKLRDLAYYKTGGSCDQLLCPSSTEELAEMLRMLTQSKTPYYILGGGTNSLVSDEHYRGAVISFRNMRETRIEGDIVHVEAGLSNTELSELAHQHSLAGAAWMYRLPGQIGGTVRMNARCYGGEISQIVSSVTAASPDGSIHHYSDSERLFQGYKDTVFMRNHEVITNVSIQLRKGSQEQILSDMQHCEEDRNKKDQFLHPSCGCVFKNDYSVGVPSGMLLDHSGVHELSTNRVMINRKHANFVFNCGASSREILEITLTMRDQVYQKFGVWLEYEMEILGTLPLDLEKKVLEKRDLKLNEKALGPLREKFSKKN